MKERKEKKREEKKERIRRSRLAGVVCENLASSTDGDSIVPKAPADTTTAELELWAFSPLDIIAVLNSPT